MGIIYQAQDICERLLPAYVHYWRGGQTNPTGMLNNPGMLRNTAAVILVNVATSNATVADEHDYGIRRIRCFALGLQYFCAKYPSLSSIYSVAISLYNCSPGRQYVKPVQDQGRPELE